MIKLKNTAGLLVASFVLFSCHSLNEQDIKMPANIINEDTFTKILVDFALAESAANLNIKNAPLMKLDTVYAFDPLEEHHVTKSKYDSTLLFYSQNATLYKKVYENVLASLSELQTARDLFKPDSVSSIKP